MTGGHLSDRFAIVTGASEGLGREIASALLAAGANVAICSRRAESIEAAASALRSQFPERSVIARVCDISTPEDIDALYSFALSEFGKLELVINNAGIHGAIGSIDEVDWAEWQKAISINLLGTVYSCRCAARYFKQRKFEGGRRGKIINLSGGGATAPQPGLSAYGASKAGLVRFTESLAEELRPYAIDVNAVAPGALATRLLRELQTAGPERIGAEYHARIESLLAKGGMSMKRAAELCVYLCSSASDGVTGRLLSAAWDPWPFEEGAKQDLTSNDIYTLRRIVPEDRGRRWGKES